MPDHTITASVLGSGGTLSPNGAVTVADGGSQAFTATPGVGYETDRWKLDGLTVQEGGNLHTVSSVTADHSLVVNFAKVISFSKSSDVSFVLPKQIKSYRCFGHITPQGTTEEAAPPVYWPSTYSAGTYSISYLGGARFELFNHSCWFLDYDIDSAANYELFYSGGEQDQRFPPGTLGCFPSAIALEAANAGAVFTFLHTGGQIGMALDFEAYTAPGVLLPYFQLCGLEAGLYSDVYFVGGKTKILNSDVVFGMPVTVRAFTLNSSVVFRQKPLAPGQQNLLSQYLQQQRDALLQKNCTTCAPIDCVDSAGLGYSLESPEFPTVFVCPEGFDCNLIGEDFHLICCDGTVYDLHFSPQVSQEDRKRVVDSAIAECARKLAFCTIKDPCPTPPCINIWLYWNNAISCTEKCPTSSNTFRWTVPAGVYLAFTQEAADQTAGRAACQLAKAHRICFSDLQSTTCIGETYDDEIIISGRFIAAYPNSDTISIIDGALPDGLTLNDGSSFVTGGRVRITGTPTISGTFTFTVSIVLGTLNDGYGDTQTRTYTIKVSQVKPDTLPDAKIGVPYSQNLSVLPAHDQETEEWSVVTSLPAGLTLTPAGILRGTPTGPTESHNVTVRVSFILDGEHTFCGKQYTLTVNDGCNEQTLVPYRDSGWKYLQIGVDTDPPTNYETVAFDDSGWSTGQAAFGEGPEIGTPCPLIATVHTAWTRDTRLVLRKHVTMAAGTKSVRLRFAVDNDVLAIWFNGVLLASNLHHDFCPSLPNFEKLAGNGTVIAGDNVVAVLCRDHYLTPIPNGDQSFFDLSVVACVP